jgi:hypothetical protein
MIAVSACKEAGVIVHKEPQKPSGVVIYTAKTVITMAQEGDVASAVAVEDGHIVGVGDLAQLEASFPQAEIDETFSNKTILPGLIDPHIHVTLGAMQYALPFVPPWDMLTPDGMVPGLPDREAFLTRLAELEADAPEGAPLIVYGYHNLVHGDIDRHDLDAISATRRIVVWHYSSHDFYLNTTALEWMNVDASLAEEYVGVPLGQDGLPTGRIYEDAPEYLFQTLAPILLNPAHIEKGFAGLEKLIAQSGVTTVAELGYGIFNRTAEDIFIRTHYTQDDAYRLYLVPEHRAFTREFGDMAPTVIAAMTQSSAGTPAPVLPQVKFFTDAAFYSQTMKLREPGYVGGQSAGTDGLWVTEPEALAATMRPYWEMGFDIRIHSNGDAAQDATLKALEKLREERPAPEQIMVLEHAALMRPGHIDKARQLGAGVSAASHYVFYMGWDFRTAIGNRVKYITPLASVSAAGVPVTLHSDAPLAPLQPMRAASVHMSRATRQGGASTPTEGLSAHEALEAITRDAAWALGLEKEIGTIEEGKHADFTILEANPLDVEAENWPDIPVWGVVLAGKKRGLRANSE